MGKYTELKGTIPKFVDPGDESGWRETINKKKGEMTDRRPAVLAERYAIARAEKDLQKERLKEINGDIQALEELLVEAYEEEQITSLTLESGGSVRVQVEPVGVVKDKEAFRLWCIAEDLASQMHLHSQTMQSLLKERLLGGQPEPEGIEAFMKDKVVFTRAKE